MKKLDLMLKDIGGIDVRDTAMPKADKNSPPVFTKEDVTLTTNMLSKLMRAIFVKEKISSDELKYKQRIYLIEKDMASEIDSGTFLTAKTNLIAALSRPRVTFVKLYEALVEILGYSMDITIHLTRDGKTTNYRYSELMTNLDIDPATNKSVRSKKK